MFEKKVAHKNEYLSLNTYTKEIELWRPALTGISLLIDFPWSYSEHTVFPLKKRQNQFCYSCPRSIHFASFSVHNATDFVDWNILYQYILLVFIKKTLSFTITMIFLVQNGVLFCINKRNLRLYYEF